MRLLHVLLAALVVVLSLTAVQVEAQKKRTVRNSVTASTNTTTSCTRGIRYRTWFTRFDTCDLPKVVKDACSKKDGRLAYDAIWDIRGFHGYNCGRDQKFYMKNSHENICGKVAATPPLKLSMRCLKNKKKKPKKTLKQRRAERRKRREAARKRRAAARKKRRDAKRKRAAERKKRREAAKKKNNYGF
ncbi:hypothetical protein BC829DRAFT_380695 [Chytridium lagenaria]|nr:hypothetical protein BC829DRAFT_380695 [Chytridium lagenaria]